MSKRLSIAAIVILTATSLCVAGAREPKSAKPEVALTDSGNALLAKYSALLKGLQTEITQSIPTIDPQKSESFLKAYSAEAAAKAALDGAPKDAAQKSAKEAAATLARAQADTLSAAQAILDDESKILSGDQLDAQLAKCSVLANATPRELAVFAEAGKEEESLVESLLANADLMKQMLVAGGAKGGNYGRAMQIYSQIQHSSKNAGTGILQRLALGTSLEQAVQGGKNGDFDPVKRYLQYEKAYLHGELDPAFKNMNAWECRMITNGPESDEDLAWCREMLRNYRPDQITELDYRWRYSRIVRTDVPYRHPQTDSKDPTSTIKQFLAGGGECGPRAFVGRFALRAFGIPTWGVTQPGHAAVAHWTPAGWTINLGADWKFSWWEERPGTDFHLESQARAYPKEFIKVLRAQWIGDALGEQKVNPKKPGSGGLWNALALYQEKAIVVQQKPVTVALAGEDLAEATEPTKAEAIIAAKITADDKKIGIDSNGMITIPAAGCSKPVNNTKNINFAKSFSGGMQMSYHKNEPFEYQFEVATAGKYELTASVVTVHKNQKLDVVANGDHAPIAISLPYTIGMWQETTPVEVTLIKGINTLHFAGPPENMGMTIKQFRLTPVK